MSDFDGLLPPRRPAPPLPRRETPQAIVTRARGRRRKKAAQLVSAGGALSLAIAGFAALRPAPSTHGLLEAPAASRPPSASAPLTTVPPAPPRQGAVLGPQPTQAPSSTPGGTASPAAPAQGTPPAGPLTTVRPSQPPERPPQPWQTYTRVDRVFVDDSGEDCAVAHSVDDAGATVCIRARVPATVPQRRPADLVVEVCAQVQDQRIRYDSHQEAIAKIHDSNASEVFNAREEPNGLGAHELRIPAGRCARYAFHWDGKDNGGRFLAPGKYELRALLPGNWTKAGKGSEAAFTVE